MTSVELHNQVLQNPQGLVINKTQILVGDRHGRMGFILEMLLWFKVVTSSADAMMIFILLLLSEM